MTHTVLISTPNTELSVSTFLWGKRERKKTKTTLHICSADAVHLARLVALPWPYSRQLARRSQAELQVLCMFMFVSEAERFSLESRCATPRGVS